MKGFHNTYPGIQPGPTGTTLTIKGEKEGTGKLDAVTNGYGAGIGASSVSGTFVGNIVIEGGIITATGGNFAAGIGAAYRSNCGNITIKDGVTKVTAKGGEPLSNSIGKAYGTSCGTVTIGGKVYWDGESYQNGGSTYLTINPIIYPAPEVGGVSGLDPFTGGGDPIAN